MELHFPPEGTPKYTWDTYQQEILSGTYPGSENSFCRKYMEVLESVLESTRITVASYSLNPSKALLSAGLQFMDTITSHERSAGGMQYAHMTERCQKVNYHFKNFRQEIARQMTDFLIQNDGVIDQWPDADDIMGVQLEKPEGPESEPLTFHFNYFGSDFTPAGYKVCRKRGREWHHDFTARLSKELEITEKKLNSLRSQASSEKNRRNLWGRIKQFVALQPAILAVVFLILSLVCYFMGVEPTDQLDIWMQSVSWMPGILLLIPQILLFVLAFLSELLRLNAAVFWIGTIIITGLGILCGFNFLGHDNIHPVSKQVYQKTLADLEDAELRFMAEKIADDKYRKEWAEICEIWNRAYFTYLNTHS